MLRKLILLSTLCCISAPAFATEADFQKRMARGVVALESGDAATAQDEFRTALKEHPTDPEATLYLAIALNRANDPDAESALKQALRLDPANHRINLELGTFYYNRKMFEEAGDYFENLLAQKPDAEMKTAADGYLAAIRKQSSGKRWGITAAGGMQYDSNVPLAADSGPLPVGVSRKGDLRGLFNIGLNGVAFRDSQQELTGSYSFYQTAHLRLSDFNLTQNLFDVTYKRRISPLLSAKVSGNFESILLGGKLYDNDFSIAPGLFGAFRERMTSGVEYRMRASFYNNTGTYPTNSDRNGVTHALILTHRQQLSEIVNARAGYTFERDLAKVDAWSSSAHLGSAGVAVTLPNSLLLDITLDAASRKYDETMIGESSARSDATLTGGASLTWQQSERLGVSLGYSYTSNASNISGYDYSRSITSIMVQGRY
ncbi:MAG: hypothetical protein A2076_03715 [Geobacteraceae bacterium GWC2_53_11]|nr:MAG: hypothetical protein A2076_03715 [Geobacteraceae bacterium GWC2_53_11]